MYIYSNFVYVLWDIYESINRKSRVNIQGENFYCRTLDFLANFVFFINYFLRSLK